MNNESIEILENNGIKPTPNRILVINTLLNTIRPLSLSDIESRNLTMDKSSIFRVLNLFKEHDIVHVIEDGSGSQKYEICTGDHKHGDDDSHVHFYCERCQQTFCMNDIRIPAVTLPDGYLVLSTNYIIKGICPVCKEKR